MTPGHHQISWEEIEHHLERGRRLRAQAMKRGLGRLGGGIAAALRRVAEGWARRRRRRAALGELRSLPPGILKDIGLNAGDIPLLAERYGETGRPAVRTRWGILSGGEKIEPGPEDTGDPGHALRTPLTSIRSFSEIVRDNPELTPAERAAFLGIVVDETLRLEQAIDHVLDDRRAA